MSSEIQIFSDYQSLSQAAAQSFIKIANLSIKSRGVFRVALSGGNTPLRMFSILSESDSLKVLNWSVVNVYWNDERCVPPSHPESNYGVAREKFLGVVGVPAQNIHRIQGELGSESASKEYSKTLKENVTPGQGSIRFDLVLLGLGGDGHTASIFPGAQSDPSALAQPAQAIYQNRPAERVTLTPLALNNSEVVIFLVSGADKSVAVKAALEDDYDPVNKPAQRIRPLNGHLIWMLDQPAASLLSSIGEIK